MNVLGSKSDVCLQSDVLAELKFEPSVNIADIGVLVHDGVVTLNGYAETYSEKWGAVRATKRVGGVKAIADDIQIRLPDSVQRNDGEIASDAADQINSATTLPENAVTITVSEGWITLEGELEWWYQKTTAEDAVHYLAGVKGVTNLIKVNPKRAPRDVEATINGAYARNAMIDGRNIRVETAGGKVTLYGTVRTYAEKEEAERVAWAAAGVRTVDSRLVIEGAFWGA